MAISIHTERNYLRKCPQITKQIITWFNNSVDAALVFREAFDVGFVFRCIQMYSCTHFCFTALCKCCGHVYYERLLFVMNYSLVAWK